MQVKGSLSLVMFIVQCCEETEIMLEVQKDSFG